MVVEESIHVIFYESNNSLQERESFDDDLGLETSMGKLQIEDRRQQEEVVEDPKKEESPLALPPPQQVQATKGRNLHQSTKYIRESPQKVQYGGSQNNETPMSSSIKLDMDEKGKPVNSTMYRGMIGSLLYLTASRPDMYSVCLCARFQSCPKESHLSAVKRILRYLKGTMDIGLWYPKGDNFELIGYSDADFAGCKVERKSTSDTCHFLGHSLVSWHSKKQNSVALSMAAEYIAAGFQLLGASSLCTGAPQGLLSFISMRLGLWGKRPAEPSLLEQMEARRNARDGQTIGTQPNVTSRVLHHMTCFILLPRGGHRDEVSYLEAFIVDSILTERRIHVGYLMMMHMISCIERRHEYSLRSLPYPSIQGCRRRLE
ncbi:Retrovirus-related Pol polyprotein from transposon RE1 [Vitis vinifera]|uniref:Retrovirus-related Pol polyprotein from transposon RE1 n=1 Tax=Vitis vinifera TaxID=29760 RepID=A0A438DC85_VITVI|nr:Retrovirus-related Pol polyprotein from transposon RE1 [Vitis vinifera]